MRTINDEGSKLFYRTLAGYGVAASSFFAALIYSLNDQSTDVDNVITIIERLGIPLFFLFGLLYILWRGGKAIAPFLKEQVEILVKVPQEQLKLERQERMEKQIRFEDIISKISEEHNNTVAEITKQNTNTQKRLIDAIDRLSDKIEKFMSSQK